MSPLRRHPSHLELEAWFDGESPESLGWHISSCTRCLAHVERLSKVRAVFIAAPVPVGATVGKSDAIRAPAVAGADGVARVRYRPLVAATAVVVALGALAGLGEGPLHGALFTNASSSRAGAQGHAGHARNGSVTGTTAPGSSSGGHGSAAATSGALGSAGGTRTTPSGSAPGASVLAPLRLAVIVPTTGTAAAEGAQVAEAVQKAVAEADAAGGVHGAPVRLTVVPAEDAAAIAALPGHVDAVVGGFGAAPPPGVPWLLPADPALGQGQGSVVAAEPSQAATGAHLADDLVQRGYSGTVGVVNGGGPDAALADGIAGVLPISQVPVSAGQSCVPAVQSLTAPGATKIVALAVAGPPSMAASCLSALAALSAVQWPPGGILVAPSAAYDGANDTAVAHNVTTVLGLPWPTSSSAGATRFRAVVPGVSSYRALVSFAATEMAVEVARDTGTLTMAALSSGTWRSDLIDYAGISNDAEQVVVDGTNGWAAGP
jgi:hypothetical protein